VTDLASLAAPIALVAAVVLAVLVAVLWRRSSALAARFDAITRGETGQSLEAVLDAHIDKVYTVAREVDTLAGRTATLEAAERKALARVGLVRFNPFEDTGGNQSFVLALLDADGDGVVLTSLHTRQATRLYAKPVRAGKSDASLSAEEVEALGIALGR